MSLCVGDRFLCRSESPFRAAHETLSNGICRTGLWAAFEHGQAGTAVPSWSCSTAVYKPLRHIPLLSVQWIHSWWRTDELSETCRFSWQNKFVKLVHLFGFVTKKFVTMHGHMNVKKSDICKVPQNLWRGRPRGSHWASNFQNTKVCYVLFWDRVEFFWQKQCSGFLLWHLSVKLIGGPGLVIRVTAYGVIRIAGTWI
jgi:hypothetical protein